LVGLTKAPGRAAWRRRFGLPTERTRYNLKEKFCCRFAADAATADQGINFLLRSAEPQGSRAVMRSAKFVS